jgi:multidrug efflux pump
MRFTDIFIRRPVLATVVSLLILVLGLRCASTMPILQYPRTQNAVVTVSTTYYGADPALVAGYITTPLENAIAQANGIDYMSSTSQSGASTITVTLRLNYDVDNALTEINTKVNSVLNLLPQGSQQPVLSVKIGQTIDAMYIGFNSDVLPTNQITDYLVRSVQPKLQAVPGVQTAELIGGKNLAMRAWLDPDKLAAYGITAADVSQSLVANNYLSSLGNSKGLMVQVNLTASTDLHSVEDFKDLPVKQANGAIVRLRDVAKVVLGSEDYETHVGFDGKTAVYLGIQVAPTANLLDVIAGVRAVLPEIQAELPQGLHGKVIYDSTKFVTSSIHEVISTLVQALLIVTGVVFLFLGSPRSVLIPVIAIPLSLIGTFSMMLLFGFTINLLTLLAMVLAIGLVVDDAIIMVENVNRHLEEGKSALAAALEAARELGAPIIAMTVVLIAVYIPIGFQGGLTGALFTEFAFTLVGAITVSAIIALTLTPMMCSRLLKPHRPDDHGWEQRLTAFIDRAFEHIHRPYTRILHNSLSFQPVSLLFALIVLISIYFLYTSAKTELAPQEDQGVVLAFPTGAPNATLDQRMLDSREIYRISTTIPEIEHVFSIDSPSRSIAGMVLLPWDARSKNANQIQKPLQADFEKIAGVRVVAFQPPSLPGATGLPVQVVIGTTNSFDDLDTVSQSFLQAAQKSGAFVFIDTDLRIDQPQSTVVIDRDKTTELGLKLSDVGSAMSSMLGGGYTNFFSLEGRSYKVIPQVQQRSRLNADQLLNYYIHTPDGTPIPLSTIAKVKTIAVPESLNRFQQLNAATIAGVAMPGVTSGEALERLRTIAKTTLPAGYTLDFAGQSRQYVQESSGFATIFFFALIIIFLALAALYESFRDPIIILISVPMSIAGALLFISLGVASLNIYTQVGLVTLMGLVSKHGILIVEVANELQRKGKSKREAIEGAAGIRLRPILMTTAAMVLGVIPLIVSQGAGAASRFDMGLVIASGISIGTFFTLFIVPAVYMLIAARHAAEPGETAVAADMAPVVPHLQADLGQPAS